MEEDILSWLEKTLAESQFQLAYWQSQQLPDSDDWSGIFTSFVQERRAVSGSGILLTGGDSYSKQSVTMQMMKLLTVEAYEGIFLDGMELSADGMIQAKKRLDHLLDHFYDKGLGVCLVLEGMEDCPCRRELLRFLGQKLCEYRIYQEQLTPLFLIFLDDHEQDIPVLLRNCLRLCRLQLPDQSHRMAYLTKHAKSLRHYLSLEVFARATNGASYMQLQDLIALLEGHVDMRDGQGLSDDELKALLAQQLAVSAPDQVMQTLCRSVQQLVDQLPQLLKNVAVNHTALPVLQQPQQVMPPQTASVENPGNMANKRQEVEQMTPLQLSIELFGEEAVNEMRELAQMTQ